MSGAFTIANARVVLPRESFAGSVRVEQGQVTGVDSGRTSAPDAHDAEGDYLIPGLIELHTDNFERHLMPRPKVRWPEFPALLAHDAEIAAAGVTTVYDALGVGDADGSMLRGQDMRGIVAAIDRARAEALLRADHLLHIRCEVPASNTIELFEPFVDHPLVRLVSLMDHTPGQRQWTDPQQARTYFTGKKGWSGEKFDRFVLEAPERQALYAEPHRRHFIDYARSRGIPLASHDDTTREHVEEARALGFSVSEFPTTREAASAAREHGLSIVMGAPNVVRGGSHSGNIAAVELARAGLLDSLSSDYVPASLLHAAFMLVDDAGFTVPAAIATVSTNPARSVGLDDRGEIGPGQRADLVQVRLCNGHPVVRAVWREGVRVS